MSVSPSAPAAPSLLEELDARQDDVLQQLDDLNQRVEALLRAHGAKMPKSPQSPQSPLGNTPTDAPSEADRPSARLEGVSDQAA